MLTLQEDSLAHLSTLQQLGVAGPQKKVRDNFLLVY